MGIRFWENLHWYQNVAIEKEKQRDEKQAGKN